MSGQIAACGRPGHCRPRGLSSLVTRRTHSLNQAKLSRTLLDSLSRRLARKLINCWPVRQPLKNSSQILKLKWNRTLPKLKKIIEFIEFDSASIKDQSAQIHELNIKLENRDAELQHVNYAIASMQSEINALERYTRGFNIGVMGIPEEEGGDCVTRVNRMLHDHFGLSDPSVDNAHRVSKARDGKPRQVIARFHSRATRRDVITGARDKLKNTNYRITDDLIGKNLEEKRRLIRVMNKFYQEKQRPRLTNGCLFANGKPVPLGTINAYLSYLTTAPRQNEQAPS